MSEKANRIGTAGGDSANGSEAGDHTRSAVGIAALPLGLPVEIEAEVELSG